MPTDSFITRSILTRLRAELHHKMPPDSGVPFSVLARTRLMIRSVDDQVVPLELRPIQKRYLALKRLARLRGKKPRYLLLKYRRGGFTTVEQGLSYFKATRSTNTNVLTLAQDGDTTGRLFRIPLLMHSRDTKGPPIKGPGNKYQLEFPGLNSFFFVGSASQHTVGRGETLSRVHWSEVAWSCPGHDQREKQRRLLSGLTEAASHGEVTLETTACGNELFRELYLDSKKGLNDWTAIFLAWHMDARHRVPVTDEQHEQVCDTLDDEERRLVKLFGVDSGQIMWRRERRRDLKHLFYQEYPDDDETCWLMSGIGYFQSAMVLRIKDFLEQRVTLDYSGGMPTPSDSKAIPGGYRTIWEEPEPGVAYCAGVDTSEGLPGSDPNGVGVMRMDTGRQVATVHGLFDLRTLADHTCEMMAKYSCLTGIEKQNHGHAVIQKVIDNGMGRSHLEGGLLYHHSASTYSTPEEKMVSRAGWSTTSVTRPVMLAGLREWFEDCVEFDREAIRDLHFVSELASFNKQSSGQFAADSGEHDDTVLKWAIANQMRKVDWRRSQFSQSDVSRFG